MSITEHVSEKRPRGRPRSHNREWLDGLPQSLRPPAGTLRSQLAKINEYHVTGLVDSLLSADEQRVFLGGSSAELLAGTARSTPRGYSSFAIEFGRWIDAASPTDEAIREHLQEVARAVAKQTMTFGQAAAHYRKNRLGEKAGSARSLAMHMARALDSYLRRFPATSSENIRRALDALQSTNEKSGSSP